MLYGVLTNRKECVSHLLVAGQIVAVHIVVGPIVAGKFHRLKLFYLSMTVIYQQISLIEFQIPSIA